jgi:hypothetical protein
MFRENVLTSDLIIDRVAGTMVPVALDYQKLQDSGSKEAKLLLPLMKQRDQEQGVWIFAPDGKALGGFVGFGDMVGQTRRVIDDALKTFGPVSRRQVRPADVHPHRGKGFLAGGGVCLAEYVRTLDESLHLVHPKSPVVSSVTLSRQEIDAFAPPRAAVGARWTLPERVARRLSRISSPMCYQHAPQPDWVTEIQMRGEVKEVEGQLARLAYDGHVASVHRVGQRDVSRQEIELDGEGVFDLTDKRLVSLLLVGSGELRWPEAREKVVKFEALVEWDAK